ncbi:MAG: hypothetical protein R3E89_04375 [Thiolinea sp.]
MKTKKMRGFADPYTLGFIVLTLLATNDAVTKKQPQLIRKCRIRLIFSRVAVHRCSRQSAEQQMMLLQSVEAGCIGIEQGIKVLSANDTLVP